MDLAVGQPRGTRFKQLNAIRIIYTDKNILYDGHDDGVKIILNIFSPRA